MLSYAPAILYPFYSLYGEKANTRVELDLGKVVSYWSSRGGRRGTLELILSIPQSGKITR